MKLRIYSLTILIALAAGCAKEQKKAEAAKPVEPLAVNVATAERREVVKALSVTGSLHPDETVNLSFEVPGRVSRVLVDFGQTVRKGQVVAELDRQELSLQVEKSKASLAQALARIGLTPAQADATPESTPAIRQAVAQMEDARSKFESAQKLVGSGDIAQERFTEVEKAYQARQAALEAAKDEMRTQLASVQALRADLSLAQKRLGDTTVRAPFDGAVSEKLASPGQYMKENTPILTLVKTTPMRLMVEVPESGAGALRIGTTLKFTTDAAQGIEFQAIVRQLNPSLDAKSRSLTAEARLTKNDTRLRPGMFVQVELALSNKAEIVAVPKRAIYSLAGLTKVFVVRDGKILEHRITPGQDLGDWIEVPSQAVNPGDEVAVSALPQLINGLPVRANRQAKG